MQGGDEAVGITGTVGLQGKGGIGKTMLAMALASDEAVRSSFRDGVHSTAAAERVFPARAILSPQRRQRVRCSPATIRVELTPDSRSPGTHALACRCRSWVGQCPPRSCANRVGLEGRWRSRRRSCRPARSV